MKRKNAYIRWNKQQKTEAEQRVEQLKSDANEALESLGKDGQPITVDNPEWSEYDQRQAKAGKAMLKINKIKFYSWKEIFG